MTQNQHNYLNLFLFVHVPTPSHTTLRTFLSHTPGQWGLLQKNSTCSSIWKLFREASNSIRAGLIAVASSQSPNHSVSQLAPRPCIQARSDTLTYTQAVCTTDSNPPLSTVGSTREWESIGDLPATPEVPHPPSAVFLPLLLHSLS